MKMEKKIAKVPYKRKSQNQYVCTSKSSYADNMSDEDYYNALAMDLSMDEYVAYEEYFSQDDPYE